MHSKYIHKALRKYIGITDDPIVKIFPFNNTEGFDLRAGNIETTKRVNSLLSSPLLFLQI